ncbi:MAG: HAD-IIB family hydrolase [Erysipelotrichaceae bacterium]|jgi:Cof subfamily protein (haloacid dehalogenase superfamily)|nr:HAD-IIB family hydrolase [Erysipelotrichaceae bacterium]
MKYFFFDIDGTLTNIHTGELVQSGLETLRKLEAEGNFVAIATGRAYYKTIDIAAKAQIHNFVANGGAALVINDRLVKNAPLDKEKALKIIHEADELGYGILVAFKDSIDVLMKDHRFLEQFGERKEKTNYIYKPDLDYDKIENIYKFYISMPEKDEYKLKNRDLLGHIRMGDDYFWYQHDQKDQGIIDMVDYLGGDIHDVVVFGDGENDVIMFKKEWTSIAMGNGYPPLQEKADYVTASAEEDGIRKACEHFSWI